MFDTFSLSQDMMAIQCITVNLRTTNLRNQISREVFMDPVFLTAPNPHSELHHIAPSLPIAPGQNLHTTKFAKRDLGSQGAQISGNTLYLVQIFFWLSSWVISDVGHLDLLFDLLTVHASITLSC